MADLFLPPLTPSISSSRDADVRANNSTVPENSSKSYSMSEVPEMQDPTLAWVQSLPSPNKGEQFYNVSLSRPNSRVLETPRPSLDTESHAAKSKQKTQESSKRFNKLSSDSTEGKEQMRKPVSSNQKIAENSKEVKQKGNFQIVTHLLFIN